MIGAAVEVNTHILTKSGFGAPADAYSSFTGLAEHTQAISSELAQEIAPATGLRNRLMHDYDDVDPSIVYASLYRAVDLFPKYVEAIEAYLTDLPAAGDSERA